MTNITRADPARTRAMGGAPEDVEDAEGDVVICWSTVEVSIELRPPGNTTVGGCTRLATPQSPKWKKNKSSRARHKPHFTSQDLVKTQVWREVFKYSKSKFLLGFIY